MLEKKRRNRNRPKRRAIFCPMHGCYLDSVSPKHPLFAHQIEHLRSAGMSRVTASLLIEQYTALPLPGQWLEQFWCEDCNRTEWYRVHRYCEEGMTTARYHIVLAERELWERVTGVHHPEGNVSVGEFTRRQSRARALTRDFNFVR
jgi:hypothetical protein